MSHSQPIPYLKDAQNVFSEECGALEAISNRLNESFNEAIRILLETQGRVVVTGIGKSALIAKKISATFNSTGTPSIMLHAADALHGDLGMVKPEDLVIVISKSGDSPEISSLVPHIRKAGNSLIAICGNPNSYLANHCHCFLDVQVEKEACPLNLAPTTSTTAQLVMGDALAVCLLKARGFTTEDFARFHPGGILGKKLYLRAQDILHINNPGISPTSTFREIISAITGGRQGAVAVTENNRVLGIITDGDIRRLLQNREDFLTLNALEVMNPNPICVPIETLAIQCVELMNEKKISQIILLKSGQYEGIIHIHNLHSEGLF